MSDTSYPQTQPERTAARGPPDIASKSNPERGGCGGQPPLRTRGLSRVKVSLHPGRSGPHTVPGRRLRPSHTHLTFPKAERTPLPVRVAAPTKAVTPSDIPPRTGLPVGRGLRKGDMRVPDPGHRRFWPQNRSRKQPRTRTLEADGHSDRLRRASLQPSLHGALRVAAGLVFPDSSSLQRAK